MKGVDILMSNSEYNKDQLIEHLYAVMNAETEKPYEEMDADLVEACTELILELQDKNFTLSNEEIEEQVRKIPFVEVADFKATNKNKRKKINKKKLLLIAAIVPILSALLMLWTTGDWYTVTDMLKERFGSVANTPRDEPIIIDNEEIIVTDLGKTYNSRDEFFKNEDYNVLIPSDLPEDISINGIYVSSSKDEVRVVFNNVITSYTIDLDEDIPQPVIDKCTTPLEINGILCYSDYIYHGKTYQVHFIHEGNHYVVCGPDEQKIINIIENLEDYK